MTNTKITSASVKVMQSYNYNHFEASIVLENEEGLTIEEIDDGRKHCARLTDKAVDQYKIAKRAAELETQNKRDRERLQYQVNAIRQMKEEEITPEDKAKVKALEDWHFHQGHYDYEDDYEFPEYENELSF